MAKLTLIIGSSGQDGTLLKNHLEGEGHRVDTITRQSSLDGRPLDITQFSDVERILAQGPYEEVYFLAAYHGSSENSGTPQSASFLRYHSVNHTSVVNFLECIRLRFKATRFFFANSSHIFGVGGSGLFSEASPMNPICFYGASKYLTHRIIDFYRTQHQVFAVNGILFNHESHLRPNTFLSKKVIAAARDISATGQGSLHLGDPEQKVDWGYAPDYVQAFPKILRLEKPEDFIISSGELHSVREFVEIVFSYFGLRYEDHVVIDPSILTGPRRGTLFGDSTKLQKKTSWVPRHSFRSWVELLCSQDLIGSPNEKN